MFNLKKQKGFTIVELLIVIVVIGILAALVILTFTNMQQKSRDAQRKTDLNAIVTVVSQFHADKGYFPTMADLNDAGWRTANAKGMPLDALGDPKGTGNTIAAAATTTSYGYTASGGANCNNATLSSDTGTINQCESYSVSAILESDGSTFTKSNSN